MSAGEGIGMVKDKTPFTGGKHAFLIMAHKDDETLRTLLRTLDDPGTTSSYTWTPRTLHGMKTVC